MLERFYRRFVFRRSLAELGEGAFVSPYARLVNMDRIRVGAGVYLSRGTLVQALTDYRGQAYDPEISIGAGAYIGSRCSLTAVNAIVLGEGVTLGDHVFIADGSHGYEDVSRGVAEQPLTGVGRVVVGRHAWLGYGCFVAGGIEIGEHAVVGANSFVNRSVPPFTVVAGAPARPIKRYDAEAGRWVRTPG